ncbi:MAG TPA: PqqD family protein [Trueperaceae bacterium]
MRWKTNPQVVVQRLGDSMVLVNLETDRIIELNETAAALFELLGSGLDEDQVEARLAEAFAVDPVVVRREIPAVLESLTHEKLLLTEA